jgi:hypothetical protein
MCSLILKQLLAKHLCKIIKFDKNLKDTRVQNILRNIKFTKAIPLQMPGTLQKSQSLVTSNSVSGTSPTTTETQPAKGIFFRARSLSQNFQKNKLPISSINLHIHSSHGNIVNSRSINCLNTCGVSSLKQSPTQLIPQSKQNVPQNQKQQGMVSSKQQQTTSSASPSSSSSSSPSSTQPTVVFDPAPNLPSASSLIFTTSSIIPNSTKNFELDQRPISNPTVTSSNQNVETAGNNSGNKIKGYNLNNNRQDIYFTRSASADLSKLIQSSNKKLLYSRLSENRLNIGKQQKTQSESPTSLTNYVFSSPPITIGSTKIDDVQPGESIKLTDTLKEFEELSEKTKMSAEPVKEKSHPFTLKFKPKFDKLTTIFKSNKMYAVDEQNSGSDDTSGRVILTKYKSFNPEFNTSLSLPSLVSKKSPRSDLESPLAHKKHYETDVQQKKRPLRRKLRKKSNERQQAGRLNALKLNPPHMIGGSFDNLYLLNKLSKNNHLVDSFTTYHGRQQSHRKLKESLYKYRKPSECSSFPSDDAAEIDYDYLDIEDDTGNISDISSLVSSSNDEEVSSSSSFAFSRQKQQRPNTLRISASLSSVPQTLLNNNDHQKKCFYSPTSSPVPATPTNVRSMTPSIEIANSSVTPTSKPYYYEGNHSASPSPTRSVTPTMFMYPTHHTVHHPSISPPKIVMRNNSLPTSSSFFYHTHPPPHSSHPLESQTHPNLYLQQITPGGLNPAPTLFNYNPIQQQVHQQFASNLNFNKFAMMHQQSLPSPIMHQQQQPPYMFHPFQTPQNFMFHSNPSLQTPTHVPSITPTASPISSMATRAASPVGGAYSLVSSPKL